MIKKQVIRKLLFSVIGIFFYCDSISAAVHLDGKNSTIEIIGDGPRVSSNLIKNYGKRVEKASNNKLEKKRAAKKDAAEIARVNHFEALVEKLENFLDQAKAEALVAAKKKESELEARSKKSQSEGFLQGELSLIGKDFKATGRDSEDLTVVLGGSARLFMPNESFVFRKNDRLVVRGKNNELLVSQPISFLGDIVFEGPDAELTISIVEGITCVFNPLENKILLTQGSALQFRGAGVVDIASNCVIDFGTVPCAGRFVLTDGVVGKINGVGSLFFQGCGAFVLDSGSSFYVGKRQQVMLGAQVHDYINFIVKRSSSFYLQSGFGAAFVVKKGSYDFIIQSDSLFSIGSGAQLILHDRLNSYATNCQIFSIVERSSLLCLQGGGIIVGDQAQLCDFIIDSKAISGQGFVKCKGFDLGLLLQPHDSIKFSGKFDFLVRKLINKNPLFTWSTILQDVNGADWVFFPEKNEMESFLKGKFVKINQEITIGSEDCLSRRVMGVVRGIFVSIDSQSIMPQQVARTRSFVVDQKQIYPSLRSFLLD